MMSDELIYLSSERFVLYIEYKEMKMLVKKFKKDQPSLIEKRLTQYEDLCNIKRLADAKAPKGEH